jgi:dephospho-CoA kinase
VIARIGLTGGIGSGKSTVARQLATLGALVVDTDAISRALTAPGGAALPAIAAAFGAEMVGPDGALDRARMRTTVFSQPEARRTLEAILHPLIGAQADTQAGCAQPGQVVVFDVPLLTESGRWKERVDRVLVVDCEEATQVQRVMARSGWSADEVWRVIRQQASRAARRAVADAVILNEGLSLLELQQAVCQIWQQWNLPPTGAARAS